ncbi:DUF4232 domain-containing protein [Cryobacterium sinapicolor]|uniref:DUF4232 domain-containing protein n=2 Tax=Cryobacterium sinapicolor TaxID=1259236 RepID=A0ABY2JHS1_9MICO|nr:DUF4232 domain-containing protein [Cryobacterium sinapicolor]
MTGIQGTSRLAAARPGCVAAMTVAVLMLTGCAGSISAPPGGGSTATPTPSTTATARPSATATARPSTTATPAPAIAADPTVCGPGDLALSLQSRPQDSGMGQFFWNLSLTNTGGAACTVEGYPVTTLVGSASGEPVGSASGTEPGRWYPVTVVVLEPGTSAYSLLHLGQAGAYDCPLVPVGALDVTLPGWDAATRVPTPNPIEGCDDDSTVLVRTGPLAPAPVTF